MAYALILAFLYFYQKLLEEISFEAGEKTGAFNVDAQLVTDRLATLAAREDLARYVL